MFRQLYHYRISFTLYGLFLLTGILVSLSIPRLELHMILNSEHTDLADRLFRLLTWLGDGWFALIFSAAFLFVRYRYFMMLILSYAGSGLLVQVLKRIVFPGIMRPGAFLDQMEGLQLVGGVDLHTALSFPSGHSTTAFAVLVLGGLISGRGALVFLSVLLSCMVAYTRVYLSQHFLPDILAGSLIGLLSALYFYWYFRRLKSPWLDRRLFN